MKLSELGPEALADLLADGTVSVKAATGFTGDTRTALYAAMRAGDLAYFNRGRRRLIPVLLPSWICLTGFRLSG